MLNKTKEYMFANSNDLALENKRALELLHQFLMRIFTQFKYEDENYLVETKYAVP